MANFQRNGAESNSWVGREFEDLAYEYFLRVEGIELTRNFPVELGVGTKLKTRRFDLGSNRPPILVECKSHRWTETGNMPSAKITVWNEAMFYFLLAPQTYRKVLFVLKDKKPKTSETLAEYYVKCNSHLVPPSVEIIEFDELTQSTRQLSR